MIVLAPTTYATTAASPIGPLTLRGVETDGQLAMTGLWTAVHRHGPPPAEIGTWTHDPAPFNEPLRQLEAWFAGERRTFDLRLHPTGTPFQRAVWAVLATIPYAETRSYLDVATALGSPAAVRAVGAANGRNPISIVVPCHRVVGADGSMTGYGGGTATKQWLLAHERRVAGDILF